MKSDRSRPERAGTNWIFPLRRIGASRENSSKIVRIAYGGTNFPGSPPATTAPLLRRSTFSTSSSFLAPCIPITFIVPGVEPIPRMHVTPASFARASSFS